MSEGAMWAALRPLLKGLDPVRIESPMTQGVPDVNFTLGWIELKYKPSWPKKDGPLRLDHYTKEQKTWAVRRAQAGGRVFLLLKVGKSEWLLFRGEVAALVLGHTPRAVLYSHVVARWLRTPRRDELLSQLSAVPPMAKPSLFGDAGRALTSTPQPSNSPSTLTSSAPGKATKKLLPVVRSTPSPPKSVVTSLGAARA